MVKLIRETNIFKIQPNCDSSENTKFIDLFVKNFAFMNSEVLLKNYKIRAREN